MCLYLQCFGSGFVESGSGSSILVWMPIRIRIISGSRVLFMTKNWKNWQLTKFFFFFRSKIAIYLSLDLHKGRPNYRRSLQPSKENVHTWKHEISWHFSFLWVIFALLDPDPLTWLNPDLDPKHWLFFISAFIEPSSCCQRKLRLLFFSYTNLWIFFLPNQGICVGQKGSGPS